MDGKSTRNTFYALYKFLYFAPVLVFWELYFKQICYVTLCSMNDPSGSTFSYITQIFEQKRKMIFQKDHQKPM